MSNEKVVKPISNKVFSFFKGVFLCLLSVSMFINLTIVGRILTFLPIYLFGIGGYAIFAFIYLKGFVFLFKQDGLKIRPWYLYFGLIFILFGICLTSTLVQSKNSGFAISINSYNNFFFKELDYIGNSNQVLLILNAEQPLGETPITYFFGGGLVGTAFLSLIKNKILSWVITIFAFILGLFIMALPLIIKIVKKSKLNSPKKIKKQEKEKANVSSFEVNNESYKANFAVNRANVIEEPKIFNDPLENIKTADVIDDKHLVEAQKVTSDSSKKIINNNGTFFSGNTSGFTPAKFIKGNKESVNIPLYGTFKESSFVSDTNKINIEQETTNNNPNKSNTFNNNVEKETVNQNIAQFENNHDLDISSKENIEPVFKQSNSPKIIQEEIKKEMPTPIIQKQEPVENKINEQLELDFNTKPQLDMELAASKPIFEERVVSSKKDDNNIQITANKITPEPVKEVKKKQPIKWVAPSIDLLNEYETSKDDNANIEVAESRKDVIDEVLNNYSIKAHVESYTIGPSVTRFNILYDSNVSSSSLNKYVDDISRYLNGIPVRFEPVVEGQIASGLEVANAKVGTVSFKNIVSSLPDPKKHPLAVGFGKNIRGDVIWGDFNEFPHCLVAGTSGSGKSIFIHSILSALIMRCSPELLKIGIIDPKRVEFTRYHDIPHLLCPIITEVDEAKMFLDKCVEEMNTRYTLFAQTDSSNIEEYNKYARENKLDCVPYIVLIVDEYGDLSEVCKDINKPINLLGQKARAAGIHMLLSTQSPTSQIITGPIKNNLSSHFALRCANTIQSQTILGVGGAEKLLGKGDMLIQTPLVNNCSLTRVQACFIDKDEIIKIATYLRNNYPTDYNEDFMDLVAKAKEAAKAEQGNNNSGGGDSDFNAEMEKKYQECVDYVKGFQYMSMSRLQSDCSIGFNRARKFFVRMQNEGIISIDTEGNKGCPVLLHDDNDYDNVPSSDEYSSY